MRRSLLTSTSDVGTATADVATEAASSIASMLEGLYEALPRLGLALAVVVMGILVGRIARRVVRSRVSPGRGPSAGRVFSRISYAVVVTLTVMLAATIVFPSVSPVDVLSGLGVFSIAIGFAFQDILSNLLAGILLLVRQPFEEGDQIEVSDRTGTVEAITIRETQLRTFDGQKVLIPNAEVYQSVVRVQTAYGPKRTGLVIGLEDDGDHDAIARLVTTTVEDVDGVQPDPPVRCLFTGWADWYTSMELQYWTDPEQATVRAVQDRVVRAVGRALAEEGIGMPSPITELDARPSLRRALGRDET